MTAPIYPYNPDFAIPPGWVLKEELEVMGLSQGEFARKCDISAELLGEIFIGNAPIEYQTAAKFEQVLGGGTEIWLNMEATYRDKLNELGENEELAEWAKEFPVKELVIRGSISEHSLQADRIARMLSFFDVWSVDAFDEKYGKASAVAYRHSPSYKSNRPALAAWLRLGEIEAEQAEIPDYNESAFRRALKSIKAISGRASGHSFIEAQELCRQAGVFLSFVKPLDKVRLSGAAWWLSPRKPVIQLSARHKTDDHLWFSLFHEAAHIMLHSKKQVFIDAIRGKSDCNGPEESQAETEANQWAGDFLIPRTEWDKFADAFMGSAGEVRQFSEGQGISPGIVVGRLQREGRLPWNRLNNLKRKLEWDEPLV